MVQTILVDRRNADLIPLVAEAVAAAKFVGLDCETHDHNRHEGLNILGKYDEETGHKGATGKLVFDMRRIVMCGFSVHPEGSDTAWYFNLGHADAENRLTWDEVRCVIDALADDAHWLCHNAPFEITVFASCFGYMLKRVICTMQLSVTAFGDDDYDHEAFRVSDLRGIQRLVMPLYMASLKGFSEIEDLDDEEEEGPRRKFNREVDELIFKITSKTSTAAHSYNGFAKELAYGHGLKSLVAKLFGHQMKTFEDTLDGEAHMGQLTGEQVVAYGAEDAYWVVPLFRELMTRVATTSPDALEVFFLQENPMIEVYSDFWRGGMRVNFDAIASRREVERAQFANLLRSLRKALAGCGSFEEAPNAELARRQPWYAKSYARYRNMLLDWVTLDDHDDDFEECLRVSNAVGNAWAAERKDERGEAKRLSITHYMPVRTIIYDLMKGKLQFEQGELKSNGEARGKLKTWFEAQEQNERIASCIQVLDCLAAMAGVEQRMKLYLTPYVLLTDPETKRLYPVVNCMLNTRRMAASNPNPMQLAKRGESTYVRGFFLPDNDDHLQVSLDWSAFELVIIGELSKDPEFFKAFGQLPHEDLHGGAAADILRVELPWMNEQIFKSLRGYSKVEDFLDNYGLQPKEAARLFTNLKGEPFTEPKKAYGYWRTEIGKGANFNYWYSGFLTTVGQRMGWNLQTTGTATDFYRNRFSVAEQWRLDTIEQVQTYGWVQLPDGHRRFRYEATAEWAELFKAKWPSDKELRDPVYEITRRIQRRAQNQAVNAMVQGTNAFIMKRSILRLRAKLQELGWTDQDARMLIPIHDEMVWSVRASLVPEFIGIAREIMSNHPDIFPTLKLDATPAVGVTFEPWHPTKAPLGQIELFEPPAEVVGDTLAGTRLNDDGVREVVDYLQRKMVA